jgi:hypothetical protein
VKDPNDPDPEKKKVNNSDEQEIAVNYSTQENGFDEPNSTSDKEPESSLNEESEPSMEENKKVNNEIQSENPPEAFKE